MGRLVEIYEPWEKPGTPTKQDVAKVMEGIKRKIKAEVETEKPSAEPQEGPPKPLTPGQD